MDFKESKLFGISDLNKLKNLLESDLVEYKSTKNIHWNHYHFRIINKGKRLVEEPDKELKKIQRRIIYLLKEITIPHYLHSCKGRSCITNVEAHKDTPHKIIKLDISKFYPSTSRDKVYKFWKNDMNMSGEVANLVTNITTITIFKNNKISKFLSDNKIETYSHLPTGSPSSPLLSFLANKNMFLSIFHEVTKYGGTLSIYADDITVSGVNNTKIVYSSIRNILFSNGYLASNKKSCIKTNNKGIEITGIILREDGNLLAPNRINKKIKDIQQSSDNNDKKQSTIKGIKQFQRQINRVNIMKQ